MASLSSTDAQFKGGRNEVESCRVGCEVGREGNVRRRNIFWTSPAEPFPGQDYDRGRFLVSGEEHDSLFSVGNVGGGERGGFDRAVSGEPVAAMRSVRRRLRCGNRHSRCPYKRCLAEVVKPFWGLEGQLVQKSFASLSCLDRFAAEEVNEFDDQDDHDQKFQHEGAALVEFVDHEAVELFGGSQLFLHKIFIVGNADS